MAAGLNVPGFKTQQNVPRMTPERRSSPRVSGQTSIVLSDANADFTAKMHNLSTSGVCCMVDKFIAPMSKLTIQFGLSLNSHSASIRCIGVVVRVESRMTSLEHGSYDVAIFFTELLAKDRNVIAQFVHRRLSQKTAPESFE